MKMKNQNYKTKTPVLILLFNRPEQTMELIKSLRKVQPPKIYVSIDGPRENNNYDSEKIREITHLLEKEIDWSTDIYINHLDNNYGCGLGPRKGITWFFENEKAGIILEDDCIPGESFFKFCDYLLPKYSNNKNIWLISGDNGGPIVSEKHFKDYDYLFTRIPLIWGWATWSDRWKKYNEELNFWQQGIFKNYSLFNHVSFFEKIIVSRICKGASKTKIKNFWDFQLYSTMLQNDGFGIIPKNNLISNIGWGEIATHTKVENNRSFSKISENDLATEPSLITSSKKINNLITYRAHTNVTDKYINSENLTLLRIGYIFSRTSYYLKFLYKYILK
tara:strand:+ start:74 stop:1075 length:1002 start_codon:yes stop_codon:yes gene_type:complete